MDITTETSAQTTEVKFDHYAATPVLGNNPQPDALDFRPGTIRDSAVANLITSSHPGIGKAAFAAGNIPDAASLSFAFTLADNTGRTQQAVADSSLYINSVSVANLWPNASYGMGNMPRYSEYSYNDTDNANVVYKMTVRNNTGAQVSVIAACKFRIITNNSLTFEQANAGAK